MLERSLDPNPALSSTLHHLMQACEEPRHISSDYLRARAEETRWESICATLTDLAARQDAELDAALALVNHHCEHWQDTHLRAPHVWMERVMRGEHVPELVVARHVDLRGVKISKAMLTHLCQAPELANVTILRMEEAALSSWATALLADSPVLDTLRELYLNHNALGDTAVARLLDGDTFHALEVLGLAGTQLGDEAMRHLAKNTSLHKLHTLQLNQNQITDVGLKTFAMSRHFASLANLHLYMNTQISDVGATALRQRRELSFPSLVDIDVYDCDVSDTLSFMLSASYALLHHTSDEPAQGCAEPLCGAATH